MTFIIDKSPNKQHNSHIKKLRETEYANDIGGTDRFNDR